jgi:phage terminase large subunit-like protein
MAKKTNRAIVQEYIDGVLRGRIVAGKLERAACQRHVDDLKRAKKKGWIFDEAKANRAIELARLLKLSSGEYNDMPFELEPFQMFIVWCLFGWCRVHDAMRRFRTAFISMASGNGKTPFAAFLVILGMAFDVPNEARAECYAVSTKDDQAKRVFDEVAAFRSKDPNLQQLIEQYKKSMYVPLTGAKLELIGAEGTVDDGMIPHIAVVDELHRFRKHHRPTLGTIKSKMAKRRQPLLVYITTAGDEQSEVWIAEYNFASMVVQRDNKVEADDLFVYIDEKDDPLDEKNWPKANPMLAPGVVKIDGLRSMAARARVDPDAKNDFIRLNTNRRVTSLNKLITSELWASGNAPLPELSGLTCHGGLDWGWKDDIAALAYVFPLEPIEIQGTLKRRVAVKLRAWIPESGRRELTANPWADWIGGGWLAVTHGQVTDPQSIYAAIEEDRETFGISTIAMDPNNCRAPGVYIETELGIPSFWFGQTCGKYNEAVQEFLDMLIEGRLIHDGNPLLAWCAMNLVLRKDSKGYRMPDKERSEEKIDPICATIMGLSEVMFAEQEAPTTPRVYAI